MLPKFIFAPLSEQCVCVRACARVYFSVLVCDIYITGVGSGGARGACAPPLF